VDTFATAMAAIKAAGRPVNLPVHTAPDIVVTLTEFGPIGIQWCQTADGGTSVEKLSHSPRCSLPAELRPGMVLKAVGRIDVTVSPTSFDSTLRILDAHQETRPLVLRFGGQPLENAHSNDASADAGPTVLHPVQYFNVVEQCVVRAGIDPTSKRVAKLRPG
jgi:hypothetical protein